MDQENQYQDPTAKADAQNANTQAASGANTENQSFDQLMEQSPMLSPLAGWLKCLRKPAISMEYSIQKRHVPDLDTDGGQSAKNGQKPSASASAQPKGTNSDTMGVSGSFTIRYFDFALGVVGLAIAGCIMKGCCCIKKMM